MPEGQGGPKMNNQDKETRRLSNLNTLIAELTRNSPIQTVLFLWNDNAGLTYHEIQDIGVIAIIKAMNDSGYLATSLTGDSIGPIGKILFTLRSAFR